MFFRLDACPIEAASAIHFCASRGKDHRTCCGRNGVGATEAGSRCFLFCDEVCHISHPWNSNLKDNEKYTCPYVIHTYEFPLFRSLATVLSWISPSSLVWHASIRWSNVSTPIRSNQRNPLSPTTGTLFPNPRLVHQVMYPRTLLMFTRTSSDFKDTTQQ